jgi:hypothetical protein
VKLENPDDLHALADACNDFAMLPFWPEAARASVMRMLAELCPHREALRWLVNSTVKRVGKWPGPAELRGMLCTRYDPADGIESYATTPGFTADDAEMRYIEREQQARNGWLLSPAEALAQIAPPEAPLPALKQLSNGTIELQQTPVNDYELGIIEREATDERLSEEARAIAREILKRKGLSA